MKAELHGKLSPSHAWEDTLTDAVFSTIDYLPRGQALGPVLAQAFPSVRFVDDDIEAAELQLWPRLPYQGDPTAGYVEPDALITVGDALVVVEAKAGAGFGYGATIAEHQLVQEWEATAARARAAGCDRVLLLALTADSREPGDLGQVRTYLAQTHGHAFGSPGDTVAWVHWADIGDTLGQAKTDLGRGAQRMVEDLLDLLKHRGIRTLFNGFDIDQASAAAQGVEAEIGLFAEIDGLMAQLLRLLGPHGIRYGQRQGTYWSFKTKALGQGREWPTTYLGFPLWPDDWPDRINTQVCVLVLFNLRTLTVEVGYFLAAWSYAQGHEVISELAADLAAELKDAGKGLDVVFSADDYSIDLGRKAADAVSADWLIESCRTSRIFCVRSTFSFDDLRTSDQLFDAVLETRALVDHCPSLLDGAKRMGFLVQSLRQ